MATTVTKPTTANPKPSRVCFSFAAYAKKVIDHLRACNVPVDDGLTDSEFAAVESAFEFTFPPDLRSILREGLPVGPSFPNWRSSSRQQLEILTNLPILGICKEVSRRNFWAKSWGEKPGDVDEAANFAKACLKKAPILVPLYRNCYIPSAPNLAGNPVFYVHGGDARLSSFDVAGFFQTVDLGLKRRANFPNSLEAPAWAATEARRIEFWTDLVERGVGAASGWWSGDLVGCMEDVCLRLRDGGWKEEDVREMTMMDGGDESDGGKGKGSKVLRDGLSVVGNLRALSQTLLRGGWSTEDVVESLGCHVVNGVPNVDSSWLDLQHPPNVDSSWLDLQHPKRRSSLLEAI